MPVVKLQKRALTLRVTVSPSQATVDYVQTSGGGVAYSYTIAAGPVTSCPGDFTDPYDGDVDGSDLAAWMGESTGIGLADFAANFGRADCL